MNCDYLDDYARNAPVHNPQLASIDTCSHLASMIEVPAFMSAERPCEKLYYLVGLNVALDHPPLRVRREDERGIMVRKSARQYCAAGPFVHIELRFREGADGRAGHFRTLSDQPVRFAARRGAQAIR
jgi:hypothetical protein